MSGFSRIFMPPSSPSSTVWILIKCLVPFFLGLPLALKVSQTFFFVCRSITSFKGSLYILTLACSFILCFSLRFSALLSVVSLTLMSYCKRLMSSFFSSVAFPHCFFSCLYAFTSHFISCHHMDFHCCYKTLSWIAVPPSVSMMCQRSVNFHLQKLYNDFITSSEMCTVWLSVVNKNANNIKVTFDLFY